MQIALRCSEIKIVPEGISVTLESDILATPDSTAVLWFHLHEFEEVRRVFGPGNSVLLTVEKESER
jgi:hypothetical protein